jgi:hypothetical protein
MARKRPSKTGRARRKPAPRKPPEGWIRIVWGQVVHPRLAPEEKSLRLRLKPRAGKARTITLTYAQTKKALRK